MKLLNLNDIILFNDIGKEFRVIYFKIKVNLVIMIELNTKHLNILEFEYSNVINKLNKLEYSIKPQSLDNIPLSYDELTNSEKKIFELRKNIIDTFFKVEAEPFIYSKKYRSSNIKRVMDEIQVSKSTAYKIIRIYLQKGKNYTALYPNYNKCGGKNKTKKYNKKPGPKSFEEKHDLFKLAEDENYGVIMDKGNRDIADATIKRYLRGNRGISKKKAYNLMIFDFYCDINELGIKIVKPSYKIPTFKQFYNYVQKIRGNNIEKFEKYHIGDKKFNLTSRELLSDTIVDSFYPGYRYEIDATRPNIKLLDRARKNVIGTPIVYLVIDSFSKRIIGMSVSLESSSWNGASSAIINCIEDKVEFCKKYGVTIKPDDWSNTFLPKVFLADNGEFAGELPEDIIRHLNIDIENTASGRGDMKGNVEKSFHLIEKELFGLIDGFSKLNYRKRGESDTNKKARLTLLGVRRLYIYSIIHYNKTENKNYNATQDMTSDRLRLTPNNIWNWGLKNLGDASIDYNKEKVIFALLRNGKGVITSKGLEFNGIRYTSVKAQNEGWFSKARMDGVSYIEIKYDQRDFSSIFIKDGNKIIEFKQTASSEYAWKNISIFEKEYQKDTSKESSILGRNEKNEDDIEFYGRVKKETIESRKLFKSNNEKSIPSTEERLKNRENEKRLNKKEEAIFNRSKTNIENDISKKVVGESSDTLKSIREKRFLNLIKNSLKEE